MKRQLGQKLRVSLVRLLDTDVENDDGICILMDKEVPGKGGTSWRVLYTATNLMNNLIISSIIISFPLTYL